MNVTLTVEQSGLRADQYLAGVLDGLTRSAAQKLLEEGRVLRRGKALKKNDKLQAGDEVAVCIPDPTPESSASTQVCRLNSENAAPVF